jgi:tetratricopeptide (TPR) repeat protein
MATPQIHGNIHDRALELHNRGELRAAAELLSAGMANGETCELWNDWGAVQASLGQVDDAERAFRRALRMNSGWLEAAENLGVLLFAQGRNGEARQYLLQAMKRDAAETGNSAEQRRGVLGRMLALCGGGAAADSVNAPVDMPRPTAATVTVSSTKTTENSENLRADSRKVEAAAAATRFPDDYDAWCESVFGRRVPVPGVRIAGSWAEDSSWGLRAYNALALIECECAAELLKEIQAKDIPGDVVEFGIFEGWWVNFLWQTTETQGLKRRIYGFDSFEGLSEPHPQHDQAYWKKGQYACGLEQVSKNVHLAERPRLRLVKGFFEKSLHSAEALLAERFCYARIDCDIYEPALECLRYLGPRLADGAIVVFDDWPHMKGFGEQRALEEWLPSVPNLKFEFLFYGAIGHFYTRAHHRKMI